MKIQRKKNHPAKKNRLRRAHKTAIEEQERSARSRTGQTETGRSGDIISLQQNLGNRAVQRLLVEPTAGKNIQLEPTDLGMKVKGWNQKGKDELLAKLLSGEKTTLDYIGGNCFDTAAFVGYLRGLLKFTDLQNSGQNLLPVLKFTSGTLWQGEAIPAGALVGFRRVQAAEGLPKGFFHAAVGIGGTNIRGVNGHTLGTAWIDERNIAEVLTQEGGVYKHEGQEVQVWYRT